MTKRLVYNSYLLSQIQQLNPKGSKHLGISEQIVNLMITILWNAMVRQQTKQDSDYTRLSRQRRNMRSQV